ncbi:ectoine hydroxylase [Isoptericola chiayiensis]|uniref:Ectoine hydroxylase n=1 Tax=Isoptericola chiayiensis TaxID=579446 RepID=A0ABP8YBP4_9MICO|nr:ectoine hydroxylase [Isoptericola chiayiensis]NOV99794.1 ectoine hydroxylase [Isoptericola chiayiensis]
MTATTDVTTDLYPTRLAEPGEVVEREHPTVWGRPEDGPFDAEALDAHAERGFSILNDFITPDEVRQYSAELNRLSTDESIQGDHRVVTEKTSGEVRSIFEVTQLSEQIEALSRDPRLLDRARQLLGSDVYLHQTRVNYMPGYKGAGFYWHSDFETWHAEDGMPAPRAVSCSIALTPNYPYNGGLMVMPGSHRSYVPCVGETPADYHKDSLKEQKIGVPTEEAITELAWKYGVDQFTGPAGSALWFDCNIMHGSGNNITPFPRSNIFLVFNSVENTLTEPYSAPAPRPEHIGSRDFTPLR